MHPKSIQHIERIDAYTIHMMHRCLEIDGIHVVASKSKHSRKRKHPAHLLRGLEGFQMIHEIEGARHLPSMRKKKLPHGELNPGLLGENQLS